MIYKRTHEVLSQTGPQLKKFHTNLNENIKTQTLTHTFDSDDVYLVYMKKAEDKRNNKKLRVLNKMLYLKRIVRKIINILQKDITPSFLKSEEDNLALIMAKEKRKMRAEKRVGTYHKKMARWS